MHRFQEGDTSRFAIECLIPEVQPGMDFTDPNLKLLGYIRFWAGGESIGDFHCLYYISVPYHAFIDLRPMRNRLHDPELCGKSAEEVNRLFETPSLERKEERLADGADDPRSKHELTGRFGVSFDDFAIRFFECGSHDRLVWFDALTGLSYEATLPRGIFFTIAEQFIAWYIAVVVEFKTAPRRLRVR